jgi:hypothetical protein
MTRADSPAAAARAASVAVARAQRARCRRVPAHGHNSQNILQGDTPNQLTKFPYGFLVFAPVTSSLHSPAHRPQFFHTSCSGGKVRKSRIFVQLLQRLRCPQTCIILMKIRHLFMNFFFVMFFCGREALVEEEVSAGRLVVERALESAEVGGLQLQPLAACNM